MTHSRTIAHGFGRLHRQWRHMSVLFRSNFTHHLLPIAQYGRPFYIERKPIRLCFLRHLFGSKFCGIMQHAFSKFCHRTWIARVWS